MNAKKITGIVLLSVSLLFFLALTTVFSKTIGLFLLGIFGFLGYPLFLFLSLIGIALIKGAKYQFSVKFAVYIAIFALCISLILHLAFTHNLLNYSYSSYLSAIRNKITPGGALLGAFAWPLQALIFPVGAYVVLILTMTIIIALMIDYLNATKNFKRLASLASSTNYSGSRQPANKFQTIHLGMNTESGFYDAKLNPSANKEKLIADVNIKSEPYEPKFEKNKEKAELSAHEEALIKLGFRRSNLEKVSDFNKKNASLVSETAPDADAQKQPKKDVSSLSEKQLKDFILTPKTITTLPSFEFAKKATLDMMNNKGLVDENKQNSNIVETNNYFNDDKIDNFSNNEIKQQNIADAFFRANFSATSEKPYEPIGVETATLNNIIAEEDDDNSLINSTSNGVLYEDNIADYQQINKIIEEIKTENPELSTENTEYEIKQEDYTQDLINADLASMVEKEIESAIKENITEDVTDEEDGEEESSPLVKNFKQNFTIKKDKPDQTSMFEKTENKKPKPTFTVPSNYTPPPLSLLNIIEQDDDLDNEELKIKAEILEETLNNFKVPVSVVAITKGPAVTRYELQVQQGITVKKILQFSNDIAMALEAKGSIRIEAPIPGKNAVGIEVPNNKISTVGLRDILSTNAFTHSSPLAVGLGRDIAGQTILCDIKSMPHLLVAGATGSGKSVCLSVILVSLLYKMGPDDLKLILIDPKRVEFSSFNGLPHMLLSDAITEPKDAISALTWAMNEMDRRFTLFHELRVNKIDDYNNREQVRSGKEPKLPTIVIVIDELADLIMTAKRDVEEKIRRLSQLARAAGIHLIVATQRPSVDVITGTIKANLPSRIAFMVSSGPDSKTILDQYGAESLLGKGDMLYSPYNYSEPKRVQCAFVSGDEVREIVAFIKENNDAVFDKDIEDLIYRKDEVEVNKGLEDYDDDSRNTFDPILPEALKLAIETRQASVSMIQRRFAVGYSRAARIIDQMERAKFVSPSDGSKARSVYITMQEYEDIFGEKEDY